MKRELYLNRTSPWCNQIHQIKFDSLPDPVDDSWNGNDSQIADGIRNDQIVKNWRGENRLVQLVVQLDFERLVNASRSTRRASVYRVDDALQNLEQLEIVIVHVQTERANSA
jgi:hypothetical protein